MEIKEKIKIGKKLWYRKNKWLVALMILFYAIGILLFFLFHEPFIIVIFSFFWIFFLVFMNKRKISYVEELVFDSNLPDSFFSSAFSKNHSMEEDYEKEVETALLMKEMELSLGNEYEDDLWDDKRARTEVTPGSYEKNPPE